MSEQTNELGNITQQDIEAIANLVLSQLPMLYTDDDLEQRVERAIDARMTGVYRRVDTQVGELEQRLVQLVKDEISRLDTSIDARMRGVTDRIENVRAAAERHQEEVRLMVSDTRDTIAGIRDLMHGWGTQIANVQRDVDVINADYRTIQRENADIFARQATITDHATRTREMLTELKEEFVPIREMADTVNMVVGIVRSNPKLIIALVPGLTLVVTVITQFLQVLVGYLGG